ncbi:M3 family metallopeptidase, partial [Stenotrophomonas acidaminiphila]|nr:M3 family metallopeptidase [Stenotrophomonas acidaminiphila]
MDSALNPEVTIDDAYDLVMKSVEPLGQEYCQEVARYQEERWVDFAANSGKDSGGYAADPYRVHPYVLMSWTGRLSDVYTLIHEIGHSGQLVKWDNLCHHRHMFMIMKIPCLIHEIFDCYMNVI